MSIPDVTLTKFLYGDIADACEEAFGTVLRDLNLTDYRFRVPEILRQPPPYGYRSHYDTVLCTLDELTEILLRFALSNKHEIEDLWIVPAPSSGRSFRIELDPKDRLSWIHYSLNLDSIPAATVFMPWFTRFKEGINGVSQRQFGERLMNHLVEGSLDRVMFGFIPIENSVSAYCDYILYDRLEALHASVRGIAKTDVLRLMTELKSFSSAIFTQEMLYHPNLLQIPEFQWMWDSAVTIPLSTNGDEFLHETAI